MHHCAGTAWEAFLADWADVYVGNTDDRIDLQSKALFFIPSALGMLSTFSINISTLTYRAQNLRQDATRPTSRITGRSAITKVMGCEPVVYESAVGFMNVANKELESRGNSERLELSSIVACVFELDGFAQVATALGLSAETISTQCDIPARIISAAIARSRLQYVDAEKIWKYCLTRKQDQQPDLPTLTDDPRTFIRTRVSKDGFAAIRKIEEGRYVYERDDLRPAPLNGHPWSIR